MAPVATQGSVLTFFIGAQPTHSCVLSELCPRYTVIIDLDLMLKLAYCISGNSFPFRFIFFNQNITYNLCVATRPLLWQFILLVYIHTDKGVASHTVVIGLYSILQLDHCCGNSFYFLIRSLAKTYTLVFRVMV
jgi:hypothetical protein